MRKKKSTQWLALNKPDYNSGKSPDPYQGNDTAAQYIRKNECWYFADKYTGSWDTYLWLSVISW